MSLSIIKGDFPEAARQLSRLLTDGIRDLNIRQMALNVTSFRTDKIVALYEFVKQATKYTPDPVGRELFTSPARMLEQYRTQGIAYGDCDCLSLFFASLAGSIGYEVKLSCLDTNSDLEFDHCIASVYSPEANEWVDVDVASPSVPLGWKSQYLRREDIGYGILA